MTVSCRNQKDKETAYANIYLCLKEVSVHAIDVLHNHDDNLLSY